VVEEIIKKFDEFEDAMKTHLGKVDPPLIVDLILRQKKEKNNNPIYTLEVFFYDNGTHIVVAHKIDFNMLKMINDIDFVERIRGTYSGSMASIGPSYDRDW
jgi:hypothetical protein